MLRADNPYNLALDGSRAFMEFELASKDANFNADVLEELGKRGGKVHRVSNSDSRFLLEISHRHVDGFGLTYLLKALGAAEQTKPQSDDGHVHGILADNYTYDYTWLRSEVKSHPTQTILQRFLLQLISSFPKLQDENIGVVVNLEVPSFGSLESVWGNSIAAIPVEGKTILELSQQCKVSWKNFLLTRAERTLEVLKKRPISDSRYGSLLVSSIGDLSSLPWLTETTASSLRLGATPLNPRTLNLFVWANHGVQSILLCGRPNHPMYNQMEKVIGVWKTVIIP